jgi:NAD(P)-dependent dehydrogenase (short-subunit alcohol dehydrogenase family)
MIIITGAGRGIGAAVARLAGRCGHAVCVNYRNAEHEAAAVVEDIVGAGGAACAVRADVTRRCEVERLFARAEHQLGPLTGLVNNAGVTGGLATVAEAEEHQLEQTFRVNLLGTVLCMQEAIRRMALSRGGRGGAIVNISSTAARTGGSFEWVHYAAVKAGVDAYTRGAAREVADEAVRINAVAPGLINTDLHARNGVPERPDRLRETIPMQRLGSPQEIAEAVLWMLSDRASYVTGSVLEVSGGR